MGCLDLSLAVQKSRLSPNCSQLSCVQIISTAFFLISYAENGGAMLISSVSLSITDSTFINCTSYGTNTCGGAFYGSSLTYSVLARVCAYKCWAKLDGQSFYATCVPSSDNNFTFLSIYKCPAAAEGYYGGAVFKVGTIIGKNTNSSSNIPSSRASSAAIVNATTESMTYCTFSSNFGNIVMEISYGSGSRNNSYINFVNNSFYSSGYGLVYCRIDDEFDNCIFQNNTFGCFFYSYTNTTIYIYNCFFDQSLSPIGTVIFSGTVIGNSTKTYAFSLPSDSQCLTMSNFMTVPVTRFLPHYLILSLPVLIQSF